MNRAMRRDRNRTGELIDLSCASCPKRATCNTLCQPVQERVGLEILTLDRESYDCQPWGTMTDLLQFETENGNVTAQLRSAIVNKGLWLAADGHAVYLTRGEPIMVNGEIDNYSSDVFMTIERLDWAEVWPLPAVGTKQLLSEFVELREMSMIAEGGALCAI